MTQSSSPSVLVSWSCAGEAVDGGTGPVSKELSESGKGGALQGQRVGRRAWGAKRQETPKLPSDSELATHLDSETRILSSSFYHVPHALDIHSDPQNPRSKNVKTPPNFSHLLVFSSGESKLWVL